MIERPSMMECYDMVFVKIGQMCFMQLQTFHTCPQIFDCKPVNNLHLTHKIRWKPLHKCVPCLNSAWWSLYPLNAIPCMYLVLSDNFCVSWILRIAVICVQVLVLKFLHINSNPFQSQALPSFQNFSINMFFFFLHG